MAPGRKMSHNDEAGSTASNTPERPAPERIRPSQAKSFQGDRPAEAGLGLNLDEEVLGDIWDELLDELTTLGVGEGTTDTPDSDDSILEDICDEDLEMLLAVPEEALESPDEESIEETEGLPLEAGIGDGSVASLPEPATPQRVSTDEESDTEPVGEAGTPAAAEDRVGHGPDAAAPVNEVVNDELVMGLLHKELVTMTQVFAAVRTQPEGIPLWRMLVAQKDVDMDAIFAEVASLNGIRHASLDNAKPSAALLNELSPQVSPDSLSEMFQLGLLPYDARMNGSSVQPTYIFVTHDPTREAILEFVDRLDVKMELQYAPSGFVAERIAVLKNRSENISETDDPEAGDSQPSHDDVHPAGSTRPWGEGEGVSFPEASQETASIDDGPLEGPPSIENSTPQEEVREGASDGRAIEREEEAVPEKPQSNAEDDLVVLGSDVKAARSKDRVVTALLRKREVSPKQVAEAVVLQKEGGDKELLWRLLAKLKGVDSERVYEEAARVYAFPKVEITEGRPDKEFVMLIMETVAEDHRDDLLKMLLLPFEYDIDPLTGAARLIFITHDPARPEVHRILQELNLGRFELGYASESAMKKLVEEIFPRKNEYLERINDDPMAFDLGTSYDDKQSELIDEDALEAEISRSSLINLFEATLVEAVRQGVSDIHIFPNPKRQVEIHFRVDGKLKRWYTEEKVHPESFLAVVKDNSVNVDRFERDKAQDGFIQRWVDGALIRFRVSVLPIASAAQEIRAESIVIRVLDDRKVLTDLRKLGMLDVALERFERAIRQPYGMVILTGPTGSGKSTTLVAALHQVVTPDVNVLTVEDPVEYIIRGVRQIKLNQKLDLEGALRAILRHDPDVVMVGEPPLQDGRRALPDRLRHQPRRGPAAHPESLPGMQEGGR